MANYEVKVPIPPKPTKKRSKVINDGTTDITSKVNLAVVCNPAVESRDEINEAAVVNKENECDIDFDVHNNNNIVETVIATIVVDENLVDEENINTLVEMSSSEADFEF